MVQWRKRCHGDVTFESMICCFARIHLAIELSSWSVLQMNFYIVIYSQIHGRSTGIFHWPWKPYVASCISESCFQVVTIFCCSETLWTVFSWIPCQKCWFFRKRGWVRLTKIHVRSLWLAVLVWIRCHINRQPLVVRTSPSSPKLLRRHQHCKPCRPCVARCAARAPQRGHRHRRHPCRGRPCRGRRRRSNPRRPGCCGWRRSGWRRLKRQEPGWRNNISSGGLTACKKFGQMMNDFLVLNFSFFGFFRHGGVRTYFLLFIQKKLHYIHTYLYIIWRWDVLKKV